MKNELAHIINVGGLLLDFSTPKIMGIVNCTPDSLYTRQTDCDLQLDEDADIIDVGGYSTRPGHEEISVEEEKDRLASFLERNSERLKDKILSVDTFRAEVAEMCVKRYGVKIINDVSGGADDDMFDLVADLKVPYVLTMADDMESNSLTQGILNLEKKVQTLRDKGANDFIIDPGFGFGKTLEDNYCVMEHLERFKILNLPILVGVSRKSMIQKVLDCSADDALNGTTALNMTALIKGADILRVHDVKEARECVAIFNRLKKHSFGNCE